MEDTLFDVQPEKALFTLREAAEMSGMTKEGVRSRMKRGLLPRRFDDRGRLVLTLEEIQGLVEEGKPTGASTTIERARAILNSETDDLAKAQKEIANLRSENKELGRLVRSFSEQKVIEDRIVDSISDYMVDYPYSRTLAPYEGSRDHSSTLEMLLMVSDAHYPEVVNPDEAMGVSYGPETTLKRLSHLVDRTLRLKEVREASGGEVWKLTVAVLGDMIGGDIHDELEVTNGMPIAEAVTDMSYALYDMGKEFSEYFPQVEMIVMPGNHGRMTKKPRNKQKYNNFDFIVGNFVKGLARNEFEVVVPKDIVYVQDIYGYSIGMTHGDGSKASGFAGIPFYGLSKRANATQALRSTLNLDRLDMLLMGHFHQMTTMTLGDCQLVINGAIKGGDEYSIVTRSSVSRAVQGLLTFHKDYGWISTERIELEDVI